MQEGPSGMKCSIRSKLILAIGLPLLVIYLAVIWLDYARSKTLAVEQTRVNLRSQARAQSARVEMALMGISRLADQAADLIASTPGLDEADYQRLLERSILRHPQVHWVGMVLDAPAADRRRFAAYVRRRVSIPADAPLLVTGEYPRGESVDWARRARETGPGWGEPLVNEHKEFVSIYATPIVRQGQAIGAVGVDVDLDWLRSAWQQGKQPGEQIVVVSEAGLFLCHPDEACIRTQTTASLAAMQGVDDWRTLGEAMTAGREGVQTLDLDTGRAWAIYTPIPAADWSYASLVSEARVLRPVYDYLKMEIGILLAALALVEVVVFVVSVRITRPIEKLAKAVGEVDVDDLNAHVIEADSGDEIGEVARAFNKMAVHLNEQVEALSLQTAAREAVESELRVARNIQQSMLPTNGENLPELPGVSLHAVIHPAREVAGDFYDYFTTDQPGKIGVLIADVSGKGVPAALFMAVAKTIIRNLARSGELSPGEVLTRANRLLLENNDDASLMFVTLLFFYYDTATGGVTYANAGHNRPFVLGPGGELRKLNPVSGPVLGALDDQTYGEFQEALSPGEMLVLYTDGVTEAMSPEGVQFGDERLVTLLGELAGQDVRELSERVVHEVDTFENHAHSDDITVLAVQRKA